MPLLTPIEAVLLWGGLILLAGQWHDRWHRRHQPPAASVRHLHVIQGGMSSARTVRPPYDQDQDRPA